MKQLIVILLVLGLAFAQTQAQILYQADFEGVATLPANLTIQDLDGNVPGRNSLLPYGQWAIDSSEHSATPGQVAAVTSWYQPHGTANDWLMTPQITGITATTNLRWKASSRDSIFMDDYEVWVTTRIAGTTPQASDFLNFGDRLTAIEKESYGMTQYAWSLIEYTGQDIYIAVRNTSYDRFVLELDDLVVSNDLVGVLHATIQTTRATCCQPTGTATAIATGGQPPYTYLWGSNTGGQVTATAVNLLPGNYEVLVTDAAGATFRRRVRVLDGPAQILYEEDFEGASGMMPANLTIIDNDAAVPVNNVNLDAWSVIRENRNSVAAVTSEMNPAGQNDDWLITPAISGISPTSVLGWRAAADDAARPDGYEVWVTSTIAGTAPTVADFLTNGTMVYSIVAESAVYQARTAALSSFAGQTIYIAFRNHSNDQFILKLDDLLVYEPCTAFLVKGGQTPTDCQGNNGVATARALGGTPPYTYQWDAAAGGQTTPSAIGLGVGTYGVTVTDALGATMTSVVSVAQATPPTVQALVFSNYNGSDVTCFGATDGELRTYVEGGTPPYAYSWNGGATTSSQFGVGAGTYTVAVTDAAGCSQTSTATIVNPRRVSVVVFPTDVLCYGTALGQATTLIFGGTPGYRYSWSTGETTSTAFNLPIGVYSVVVTDANNCTATGSTFINEPPPLVVSLASQTNNSATVAASGGVAPYTYLWSSNTGGQQTATATNLIAGGLYTVDVIDANGCVATISVTLSCNLTASAVVTTNYNGQDVSCAGAIDGMATASANGTAPYAYQWDAAANNQTTATAGNLGAGIYTVTVTDANGCADVATLLVTEPSLLSVSIGTSTPVSCFGGSDGQLSVIATGGVSFAGYTYDWSTGATTAQLSNLTAGSYTVTVTDGNGCTNQQTGIVTEPTTPLGVSVNLSTVGTATAIGGTPPYTYLWNAAGGNQTTATISGIQPNVVYEVTVTDANGCTQQANNIILNVASLDEGETVLVYPNPVQTSFQVALTLADHQHVQLYVTNALGQTVWQQDLGVLQEQQLEVPVENWTSGWYSVTIVADERHWTQKILVE